ncbi:MAG TPA: hypothetical protein VN643_11675 [Pyrinomonadaceae bacterium]|nr:hypothetical protein [Pyrinomonadaceae bacterium]
MATDRPPPYFPQGSLSPPDPSRYRKFKLAMAGVIVLVLALVAGLVIGVTYLLKLVF